MIKKIPFTKKIATSTLVLIIISAYAASAITNTKNISPPQYSMTEKSEEFITTYNFNGITNPSTTHKAGFKQQIITQKNKPPEQGPTIPNLTEFNNTAYTQLSTSDNNQATSPSSRGQQLHQFQFTIEENLSTIKSLYIHWKGHTTRTQTLFYIWNFYHQNWELISTNRFTKRDGTISKTYITNISYYINKTNKHLYIIAISQTPTLFGQQLQTDHIQIKVGNPTTVSLQDNAYHYDNQSIFVEWWFFNVHNKTQDKQFFISYHIFNPKNGIATLDIGMFDGESLYEIRKTYSASEFSASHIKPYVKIGDASINALNKDTIMVTGSLSNQKNHVTWNLTFHRTAPAYDFIQTPGETHYLCYLPSAWVFGNIELNGISYSMNNSNGYHDHNWGYDLFSPCQWTWATVCKPIDSFALTIEKVEHLTWHTYAAYATHQNNTIYFENIQTDLNNYTININPSIPFFTYYPQKIQVQAENHEGYELNVDITVLKNLPILMVIPRALNEQVSLFQGTLSKDDTILYTFELIGFSEYSTFLLIL